MPQSKDWDIKCMGRNHGKVALYASKVGTIDIEGQSSRKENAQGNHAWWDIRTNHASSTPTNHLCTKASTLIPLTVLNGIGESSSVLNVASPSLIEHQGRNGRPSAN